MDTYKKRFMLSGGFALIVAGVIMKGFSGFPIIGLGTLVIAVTCFLSE